MRSIVLLPVTLSVLVITACGGAPAPPAFAPLAAGHVEGCACAYTFAPGAGLAGPAFEHDGDTSWVGLAGRGDVRVTKVPADGSFGGDQETFTLPEGGGELKVDHVGRRMELTAPGGTVAAALEGGCGC